MGQLKVSTMSSGDKAPARGSQRTAACLLVGLILISGNPSSLAGWLAGYQAIILLSAISICCVAIMGRGISGTRISAFVWLFLVFLLSSSIVSIQPSLTVSTTFVYGILAVSVFLLSRYLSIEQVVKCLVIAGLVALFLSVVLVLVAPGKALDGGMLSGIYSHKNILGFMLAISFTANLYGNVFSRSSANWFIAILLFAGVLLTDSTTAMLACLFSSAVGLYLHTINKVRGRVGRGALTVIMLTFTGLVVETILNDSGAILALLGKSPTLSARTGIWEFVTYLWMQRPYVGYGFGAVWSDGSQMRTYIQDALRNPAATHAHNGYLDVMLQTGIIGSLVFLAILVSTALKSRHIIANECVPTNRLAFALLAFMLFYNTAESRFYNPAGWVVIVLMSICAVSIRSRYNVQTQKGLDK